MRRLFLVLAMLSASIAGGCTAQSCPTGLLTGVLAQEAGELVVVDGGGATRVVWPDGHSVRAEGDRLVLTNVIGVVVAREGDTVRLGGGSDAGGGAFKVCGTFEVTG